MTCSHVLGLIDAAECAGYTRAHLDAAHAHARGCATCGPALAAAEALTRDLRALAQPAAPAHTAASVLARIERLDAVSVATRGEAAFASALPGGWPPVMTVLGVVVAALAILPAVPIGRMTVASVAAPRFGGAIVGLVTPPSILGCLALALGLALYAAGLFATIGSRRSRGTT